ncbi:MAG: FtsH protease activity modulator HflK [Spirochaetae bacterium HGW-Spirochaetae-3]|jgi:membrane protease subunit HflK|nr:MAG: FtsH protease activity modulator HflK [Spirochaetae bacterium HGW-Spirochaetae-3]
MPDRNVTPMRGPVKVGTVILIVIAVAVIALFSTSFFVVDQTEQSVVLTLGKFTNVAEPGLHFKWPLGIQRNYNIKTRVVQTEQFGFRTAQAGIQTRYEQQTYPEESTMLTGDLNIVDVEWIIQYRITDPRAWLFNLEDKQKTIRDISQSVINMLVGDMTILDVMGSQRVAIEQAGIELMNSTLKSYGLGIEIIAVKLQNIVPPAGVQAAFEDVNKAIQDMNRLISEGKEAYNKEIPKARGQADQIVQVAKGYSAERVNKANGDVARFKAVYEEYRKAPEVTRDRLYYEMMEAIFADEQNVELIDSKLSNFIPIKNFGTQAGGTK